MAKNTRTLDAYLDAWESKRMSGGRALTEAEHAVVLEVGELVARLRLPSDVSSELVDVLRRHQNDAAGALQILAERFETSAIELDLYRRSWRDVHDAAFERLLQLRMSAMKARDASDEKIQLFKAEICSWRDQLARTRREREQSRTDRARRAAEDQLRIEAQSKRSLRLARAPKLKRDWRMSKSGGAKCNSRSPSCRPRATTGVDEIHSRRLDHSIAK